MVKFQLMSSDKGKKDKPKTEIPASRITRSQSTDSTPFYRIDPYSNWFITSVLPIESDTEYDSASDKTLEDTSLTSKHLELGDETIKIQSQIELQEKLTDTPPGLNTSVPTPEKLNSDDEKTEDELESSIKRTIKIDKYRARRLDYSTRIKSDPNSNIDGI